MYHDFCPFNLGTVGVVLSPFAPWQLSQCARVFVTSSCESSEFVATTRVAGRKAAIAATISETALMSPRVSARQQPKG